VEAVRERGSIREKVPTRWESFIFTGKTVGLRAKRWWDDRKAPTHRWPIERDVARAWPVRVEARSRLWVDTDERERILEAGKVENLRLACACLDGAVVDADGVFSFWAQIGRASRKRGFVVGRMLQQGCVIPAVGGGLCQLSNALYWLALESGCEIVERHAHSVRMPGVPVQDATVAWNYVDLRFRVKHLTRITAKLNDEELIVAFETEAPVASAVRKMEDERPEIAVQNCLTCNEVGCFRHQGRGDSH
jgi:vancomycin resistance protein YoaR